MRVLLALTTVFLFNFANGQEVRKKDIRGSYTTTFGAPGRAFKKRDNSELSILPITYSSTTIVLKTFGRAQQIERNSASDIMLKNKGRWRLKDSLVTITFGTDTLEYRFEEPVYLHGLDGKRGMQKD